MKLLLLSSILFLNFSLAQDNIFAPSQTELSETEQSSDTGRPKTPEYVVRANPVINLQDSGYLCPIAPRFQLTEDNCVDCKDKILKGSLEKVPFQLTNCMKEMEPGCGEVSQHGTPESIMDLPDATEFKFCSCINEEAERRKELLKDMRRVDKQLRDKNIENKFKASLDLVYVRRFINQATQNAAELAYFENSFAINRDNNETFKAMCDFSSLDSDDSCLSKEKLGFSSSRGQAALMSAKEIIAKEIGGANTNNVFTTISEKMDKEARFWASPYLPSSEALSGTFSSKYLKKAKNICISPALAHKLEKKKTEDNVYKGLKFLKKYGESIRIHLNNKRAFDEAIIMPFNPITELSKEDRSLMLAAKQIYKDNKMINFILSDEKTMNSFFDRLGTVTNDSKDSILGVIYDNGKSDALNVNLKEQIRKRVEDSCQQDIADFKKFACSKDRNNFKLKNMPYDQFKDLMSDQAKDGFTYFRTSLNQDENAADSRGYQFMNAYYTRYGEFYCKETENRRRNFDGNASGDEGDKTPYIGGDRLNPKNREVALVDQLEKYIELNNTFCPLLTDNGRNIRKGSDIEKRLADECKNPSEVFQDICADKNDANGFINNLISHMKEVGTYDVASNQPEGALIAAAGAGTKAGAVYRYDRDLNIIEDNKSSKGIYAGRTSIGGGKKVRPSFNSNSISNTTPNDSIAKSASSFAPTSNMNSNSKGSFSIAMEPQEMNDKIGELNSEIKKNEAVITNNDELHSSILNLQDKYNEAIRKIEMLEASKNDSNRSRLDSEIADVQKLKGEIIDSLNGINTAVKTVASKNPKVPTSINQQNFPNIGSSMAFSTNNAGGGSSSNAGGSTANTGSSVGGAGGTGTTMATGQGVGGAGGTGTGGASGTRGTVNMANMPALERQYVAAAVHDKGMYIGSTQIGGKDVFEGVFSSKKVTSTGELNLNNSDVLSLKEQLKQMLASGSDELRITLADMDAEIKFKLGDEGDGKVFDIGDYKFTVPKKDAESETQLLNVANNIKEELDQHLSDIMTLADSAQPETNRSPASTNESSTQETKEQTPANESGPRLQDLQNTLPNG
jgi:hypothetical protein